MLECFQCKAVLIHTRTFRENEKLCIEGFCSKCSNYTYKVESLVENGKNK